MTQNTIDFKDAAITGGLFETISRHGDAGAEFLKGLRGIDYATGQKFDRSLLDVANYKINPNDVERNIKQQAGFSAEIASVSKRNAQNIIDGKAQRFTRSEDLAHYGKNNETVDIVEVLNGKELSTAQMKFVSQPDELLKKIARGEGSGKNDYSRYMSVDKLEVPTEQVEAMKATCREQAQKLKEQAQTVREKGNVALADKLDRQAENYRQLEHKITDAGLSTDEAIRYRLNPRWETTKDMIQVSHRAGVEGAKFGAAIGGGISAVSNAIAVWTGNKELGDAVIDTAKDTLVEAYSYSSADRFPTLRVVLKTVIDEVLAQYGNNPGVKQEVIQYLLTNGEDILNLNPQKIQGCMASLPKIKQEILQRSVQAVLEPKQTMGITLSEREKKIILCELIGAAYSSGAFEAEEKQLLESICQTLDIDSEYIEEFDDVVAKLFKANQELAELINE